MILVWLLNYNAVGNANGCMGWCSGAGTSIRSVWHPQIVHWKCLKRAFESLKWTETKAAHTQLQCCQCWFDKQFIFILFLIDCAISVEKNISGKQKVLYFGNSIGQKQLITLLWHPHVFFLYLYLYVHDCFCAHLTGNTGMTQQRQPGECRALPDVTVVQLWSGSGAVVSALRQAAWPLDLFAQRIKPCHLIATQQQCGQSFP